MAGYKHYRHLLSVRTPNNPALQADLFPPKKTKQNKKQTDRRLRYMRTQVWFLSCFGLKWGIDFDNFGLKLRATYKFLK